MRPLKGSKVLQLFDRLEYVSDSIRIRYRKFWKSVGLNYITFTPGQEERKELFAESRWSALARCGVHILPAVVSITLIGINLYGFYIGFELQGPRDTDSTKLGALQVSAKIQELLIVSSLGEIIFHWVRWQLVYGDGLPLGLIGSGFTFSQLSFFWSPDFIASVHYKSSSVRTKVAFIALLATAGLIAALAGPATAILMIPREMDWPVGGSVFWLNGTNPQLWPVTMSVDSLAGYDCATQDQQLYDARCPSAGYFSLFQHFANWNNRRGGHVTTFEISDEQIRKGFNCTFSVPNGDRSIDAWAFTAHTPTAVLTDIMARLYQDSLRFLDRIDPRSKPGAHYLLSARVRTYSVLTKVPAVRTACTGTPTNFYVNESTTLPFLVTPLNQTVYHNNNIAEIVHRDVTSEINARVAPLSQHSTDSLSGHYLHVIPVIMDPSEPIHEAMSLGLVLASRSAVPGAQWAAVTCTIDARWAPGSTVVSHNNMAYLYDYDADRGSSLVQTALAEENIGWGGWLQPDDGSWQPVKIDRGWFEILTPRVPATGARMLQRLAGNRTTLENILSLLFPGSNDPRPREGSTIDLNLEPATQSAIEHMVSVVVADGLSRSGTYQNLNYTAQALDPLFAGPYEGVTEAIARRLVRAGEATTNHEALHRRPGDNYTQLVMQATYRGHVMAAQSWFDWCCVAILLLHCLLALGHTVRTCYAGVTSEAWDTVAELTALALVSPSPRGTLPNSCAGIRKRATLAQAARVEMVPPQTLCNGASGGSEQLRLRFFKPGERRDGAFQAKKGESYGCL